jgi:hypothetical protein
MKIRFRTDAEQGAERNAEQSRRQESSADSTSPQQHCSANPISSWWPHRRRFVNPILTWSLRSRNSNALPPTENCADHFLRRGAACCARSNAADQRYPLADIRSKRAVADPLPYNMGSLTQQFAPKIVQFSPICNRFWPKNRCSRKQTTKPLLTGARTAFSRAPKSPLIRPKIDPHGAPHARTQRS